MGVKLHVTLGCKPGQIYDGTLAASGRMVVDITKLEKLVKPRDGESIAEATARKHGANAVAEVVLNLALGGHDAIETKYVSYRK